MTENQRLSKDGTTLVDDRFVMQPIDEHTPRGVKMLLGNQQAGTGTMGVLTHANAGLFTHFAPCPTFP